MMRVLVAEGIEILEKITGNVRTRGYESRLLYDWWVLSNCNAREDSGALGAS